MAEAAPTDVAIVGIGCIFPGAPDTEQFWANIRDGVDAITDVPPSRWDPVFFDPDDQSPDRLYCRRGGFVDDLATFDPTRFGIMPVAVEGAEPDQLLALGTAAAALADAGDPQLATAPERVGVVVGRGGYLTPGAARLAQRTTTAQQLVEALRSLVPGLDEGQLAAVRDEFRARLGPVRPEASIGLVPNLAASRIANRLDFQGPAYTVDAACASSLVAVDQATALLTSGAADLMVAGGVHHCHDLTIWSVFSQLKALSPTGAIRPFSRDADGILIGEGTGLFVLQRLADAEAAGRRVYAVIRGTGVASDGRATSLMSPRPEGQVLAVRQAWERAGLDTSALGLVEAHGTATAAGDAAELRSLREVFGVDGPAVGLGSVKSMIGHAMPAAGAAGLAKAALAVHHRTLPPTLHAEEPHVDLTGARFRLLDRAEPWESDGPRVAGVNAFGFGGINAHVVISEHSSGPLAAPPPSWLAPSAAATTANGSTVEGPTGEPVLLLAADDLAGLGARLEAFAAGGDLPAPGEGPVRLAIVDPNPKRLELARKVVERGTAFRGRNDVWFEPEGLLATGGSIAVLCPGVEPVFDPRLDDVAEALGHPPLPTGDGGPSLERQGQGIVAVGRLLVDALQRLGIRADVVAGHSLGEWTGQVVTGMIPPDAVDAFVAGLEPGQIELPDVVFLALGCGATKAEELIEGLEGIGLSHDNCPHQSVLCGVPASVAVAQERARVAKVLAQEMPFRSGFHSPFFAPFLPVLREQLGDLPVRPAEVPMWSATSCAPYPDDPDAAKELAVRHLLEPVRFRELVEALYDRGARVFVQVGVGTLTGFVEDTLRDRPVVALAAAAARHEGFAQLRRVAAALWVEGAPVDLDALAGLAGAALGPAAADATTAGTAGAGTGTPARRGTDGHELSLDLGVHLVRGLSPLNTGLPAARPAAALTGAAGSNDPLLAELDTLLAEAAEAASAVASRAAARTGRRAVRPTPAPGADMHGPTHRTSGQAARVGPAAPPTPVPAPTASPGSAPGPASVSHERELSLEVEPRWADHAFFFQPDGWPDVSDRFPLVPMTGILELLADTAVELRPDLVPVALTDVRAFRWVSVEPARTVRLSATLDPEATTDAPEVRARAVIDGHARATVVLSGSYEPPPAPRAPVLHDVRPSPVPAERLYDDRWLFHGPEYRGIREVTEFGSDGICGVLESQAAPGALLDNAGQLLGYWVAAVVERDRLVLPTSIDRIAYHGPHPSPGTLVHCSVHITSITPQVVQADLELTVDGALWCRIDGWEDRRFDTDEVVFRMLRRPERNVVSEVRPGEVTLAIAVERWTDSATRDIVMRRYLRRVERDVYEARNPRAQRHHLLGRVAAKDAVRSARWAAGGGDTYPGEVHVTNDAEGRPVLEGTGPDGTRPDEHLSIAHSDGIGVAVVSRSMRVGVDVEPVEPRSDTFAAASFTPAEVALGPVEGDSPDAWLTRLWCAKEAAAKAAGTGLSGRPKDWEVVERRDADLRIGDTWVATERWTPTPASGPAPTKEHLIAWTIPHR